MIITLVLLASLAISYIVVGIFFSTVFTFSVIRSIKETAEREQHLMEMVKLYDLTPAGANYYTQLQELHISNSFLIHQFNEYSKGKKKFWLSVFLPGILLWPLIAKTYEKEKAKEEY